MLVLWVPSSSPLQKGDSRWSLLKFVGGGLVCLSWRCCWRATEGFRSSLAGYRRAWRKENPLVVLRLFVATGVGWLCWLLSG